MIPTLSKLLVFFVLILAVLFPYPFAPVRLNLRVFPSLLLNRLPARLQYWKLAQFGNTTSGNLPVIVIGGGLAGLSAAHTVLENGGNVLLIDKKPSLGGNSVKASSGINGASTEFQKQLGITDSVQSFTNDTTTSAGSLARPTLINALTSNSASAIDWLSRSFNIDLSVVSRLGGHSIPRTHRDKKGAPGWAITSSLMKKLQQVETEDSARAKIIKNARVVDIFQSEDGVFGVEYEHGDDKVKVEGRSVIVATGGYAADFASSGFLSTYRPDLLSFATTNGDHATGDGHRLVTSLPFRSGVLIDMDEVQVHPTGFIDPANPDAKTKFLAAEALRGAGGVLIDKDGNRFVDEMERRDFVSEKMGVVIKEGKAPIRLVLGVDAVAEGKSFCDFYTSKGLMRKYANLQELAEDMNVPVGNLSNTIDSHSKNASGIEKDPFGKIYFKNADIKHDEPLLVAQITPVVHYSMGGIKINASAHVLDASGTPIPRLYAAGEAIGGIHGLNRLGGSSLLEAVVFGRIAGAEAVKEQ